MQSKNFLLLVTLVLALGACSKEKALNAPRAGGPAAGTKPAAKPKVEGPARATFIRNVPFAPNLDATLKKDITGGLCAQEVIPNSGDYSGVTMLEIGPGPCPANGLAPETSGLAQFYVGDGDDSKIYEGIDTVYYERALTVNFNASGEMMEVASLCSESEDLCYIDIRNKKYDHIEMY